MKGLLQKELKKSGPFASLEQEVHLNLVRTADYLMRDFERLFKSAELSLTQYNVLRILRGAGEDGLACGQIAERMVTRDPDITRLLDRLEKRGLITRHRSSSDRRVICAYIAPAGLKLLKGLDGPVQQCHQRQLAHLGEDRLRKLVDLLEQVRRPRE